MVETASPLILPGKPQSKWEKVKGSITLKRVAGAFAAVGLLLIILAVAGVFDVPAKQVEYPLQGLYIEEGRSMPTFPTYTDTSYTVIIEKNDSIYAGKLRVRDVRSRSDLMYILDKVADNGDYSADATLTISSSIVKRSDGDYYHDDNNVKPTQFGLVVTKPDGKEFKLQRV